MRIYLGSTALIFACGLVIGAALAWALTRWYFIRVLRGIQRRVKLLAASGVDFGYGNALSDGICTPRRIKTELKRRKL